MSEAARRQSATPLLFLLDGVLSQDEGRVQEAVEEISRMVGQHLPSSLSESSLCRTLSALLERYPIFATVPSSHDGSLPLHFSASLGIVSVAKLIYASYPAAAATPNKKGKIPLHYAAREGQTAIVHFFLKASPLTCRIQTDKGKLALHFAAGEGHTEIVRSLLQLYPESARLRSSKDKVPLHFCARWGFVDIARELLHVFPEGLKARDWEGSLPLHDAAREGQVEMSNFLIQHHHGALRTQNMRGEIPLFSAVRLGHVELVTTMVQAWPEGARQVLQTVSDNDNVANWDRRILKMLLRASFQHGDIPSQQPTLRSKSPVLHESTTKKRKRTERCVFLPLHAALESRASVHVVRHVLQSTRDLSQLDSHKRLPLHWAVQCKELTDLILETSIMTPNSVRVRDCSRNLPLHLAILHGADSRIIKELLRLHPKSGVEPFGAEPYPNHSLVHVAAINGCDLSTMFELLRTDPNLVKRLARSDQSNRAAT